MADEDKNKSQTISTTSGGTSINSTTTRKPETTTSQTSESHVELSPDVQARLQQEQAQLAKSYGLNADGTPDPNVPLLGYDENKYREEQEAKARVEQFKQKEAGWRNALSVVADIIAAGFGGNVYAREKDNVAADAQKKQDEIRTNLRGMETAAQQARLKRQQDYNNAKSALEQRYVNTYGTRKSSSTNTQNAYDQTTESKSTQPSRTTTTTTESESATSRPNKDMVEVRLPQAGGKYLTFNASKADAISYASFVLAKLTQRFNELSAKPKKEKTQADIAEEDRILKAFSNAGIHMNDLKEEDYIKFLQSGQAYSLNGNNDELDKLYFKSVGRHLQFSKGNTAASSPKFTTGGGIMPGIQVEQKGDSTINTMPGVQ